MLLLKKEADQIVKLQTKDEHELGKWSFILSKNSQSRKFLVQRAEYKKYNITKTKLPAAPWTVQTVRS